jgi:hypothetical protein
MKMPKLGNVNAMFQAVVYDKNNKIIGTCGDTPNVAAYVFTYYPKAKEVKTQFNINYIRTSKDMQQRIETMPYMEKECDYSKYVYMH